MQKYFLLIVLLLPLRLFSQNNFMAISFGGNFPLQDFSEYSDLTHHGFATNGFNGDYSGGFFNGKNLGIGGNICYASNSIDDNTVYELLLAEFPEDFDLENNPSYFSGFWKYVSLLVGPEYTIPRERANLDFYTLAGINFVLPPEMSIYAETPDDYYSRSLEVRAVNLGFEAGCALRYHINEHTSIRIHASWFMSTCKGDIIKKRGLENERTSEKTGYSCLISTLNAGIGVAYRL